MDRDVLALLASGVILFLVGIIMFLAFNPTYIYFSNRIAGYEPYTLTKTEFAFFTLLDKTLMPILDVLIVVGIAMLLLGVCIAALKGQKS
jgi:hypothetical protein